MKQTIEGYIFLYEGRVVIENEHGVDAFEYTPLHVADTMYSGEGMEKYLEVVRESLEEGLKYLEGKPVEVKIRKVKVDIEVYDEVVQ